MRTKEVYPVSPTKGHLRFQDIFFFKYDFYHRLRKLLNVYNYNSEVFV